ncbi:MAG: hypothetical protein LC687_07910 [Actinobacteria bacterium]|nr:hypothetical protein [Actinomycetota bacterium]
MAHISDQDDESQQLLNDLLVLSAIPHEYIAPIAKDLMESKPYVALGKVINKHLGVPEATEAVARLVASIDHESLETIFEMVQSWRDEAEVDKETLNDEGFEQLKKNLNALISSSTEEVIRKSNKATALLTATGNEVTGLTFICDARPVYNDDKTDIEGYVPLATMRIYYNRPNEQQDVVEFTMTPTEVDAFIERATQAREKLNVMQRRLSGWLANGTGEELQ